MGIMEDILKKPKDTGEPKPDLAICSECKGKFPVKGLVLVLDDGIEDGCHWVHLCPTCPEGGLIEEYTMSEDRAREWGEWNGKGRGQ